MMMNELTPAEFRERAVHVDGLPSELHDALYPMVRDLLRMAARVRSLVPELDAEIPEATLSQDAIGNA